MTQKFSQVKASLGVSIALVSLWGGSWALHHWSTTWAGFPIIVTALTMFCIGVCAAGEFIRFLDF